MRSSVARRRPVQLGLPEPTVEQTIMILRGLRDTFEAHHKVAITDEAIAAAAELSDRYVTGRFLPDKAIDLIDQAAARVRMATTSRPPEVQELEAEVRQLGRERDYAANRKDEGRRTDIEERLEATRGRLEEAEEAWRRERGSRSDEVRAQDVADIVSKLTGIPVSELTSEEREKLMALEETLHEPRGGPGGGGARPSPTRCGWRARGSGRARARSPRSCSSAPPGWARPSSPRPWPRPCSATRAR